MKWFFRIGAAWCVLSVVFILNPVKIQIERLVDHLFAFAAFWILMMFYRKSKTKDVWTMLSASFVVGMEFTMVVDSINTTIIKFNNAKSLWENLIDGTLDHYLCACICVMLVSTMTIFFALVMSMSGSQMDEQPRLIRFIYNKLMG